MTAITREVRRARRRERRALVRGAAIAALAALFSCGHMAMAAEEGPVVVGGGPKKFGFLDFERPEMYVTLLTQYSSDSTSSNTSTTKTTNTIFQEFMGLRTTGNMFSPKFFEMSLAGTFGLNQASASGDLPEDATEGDSDGTVYTYDFLGTLRKESNLPVNVYARRSDDLVNRAFGPTLRSIYNEYGINGEYRIKALTSRLEVYHQDQSQSSLVSGVEDLTTSLEVLQWRTEWRPSDRQSLSMSYGLSQSTQNSGAGSVLGQEESDYNTQDFSLAHVILFGKDKNRPSTLESNLTYFDQSGDFQEERLQWDERLQLQHTADLQTNYNYRFFDTIINDTEQTRHEVRGGFQHRLFQSLTTTGNIGARVEEFDNGNSTTDEQFGDLMTTYTKKVPLGLLSLHAMTSLSLQQSSDRVNPIQVLDQPYTFTNYQPIVLTQQAINPNSIRITSPNGKFTYRENVDYTVHSFPGRIEIRPITGGLIGPVTPVLIDYTLDPQPAHDTDTTTFGFGGRYGFTEGAFKNLGVYANYLMQDQTISETESTTLRPDNIRDLTFGADYRFWKLVLLAEHRTHDSTVSPYTSTRFNGQFQHRPGADTSMSLAADYQILNYTSTDRDDNTNILTVSANIDHQFSRQLHGVASATWLQETTSTQGDTMGSDYRLQLEWRHRQTQIFGTIRYSTLDTDDSDNSFLLFEVGIKRTF